ncbi:MAG TPA: PASTA domain-containing protein [Oligoflexus sp.]|uniref:PASTA domain-containing protein n=1 Tax=Oligoflexus sp. TaxID=1971216 RepID=UPI002D7F048F|nr:PASTA domain-containing protein [Oligoflexus sp.]HET9241521.1 PASTA domain-containing protein [Oligoflexus sp.]
MWVYLRALVLVTMIYGSFTVLPFRALGGSAVASKVTLAKNLDVKPPLGGKGGSLGMDKPMEWVPPLEGKDPNDPAVIEEFIAGSGFSIKIVGYKASSTVKKGAIVSQVPKPYSEVKKPGKIEVIISTGP